MDSAGGRSDNASGSEATNGTLVKEVQYDSFGTITLDTNPDLHVSFGFAGGLYDEDTKLTRFGYRDYDALTGKWTAKDPIGFKGGIQIFMGMCWVIRLLLWILQGRMLLLAL